MFVVKIAADYFGLARGWGGGYGYYNLVELLIKETTYIYTDSKILSWLMLTGLQN